ncbi:heme exporter protein CcmD [Pelagibius sp.]|uniref:heme exporter protein CcmD n=1 Tax=Pelagibius sp. TaxID=1931238 RepID=UPI003B50AC74
MGGYAAFVWPSLGLTFVVMLGLLVSTLRQLRIRQRRLAALEAEGASRRPRGGSLRGQAPTVTRNGGDERSGEAAS